MNPLGTMQGRLSPPQDGRIQAFPKGTWEREFSAARECGLELIEWIFEADEWEKNPLYRAPEEIRELSKKTGVRVLSVCADYYMDRPLLQATEADLKLLSELLPRCAALGARFLTIPFVDASALANEREIGEAASRLGRFTGELEENGVTLALETSLGPKEFSGLLRRLNHPRFKVNYDIGNSASLGYKPAEEFDAYGPDIATVHVKDRVLGGSTVPLGTGDADFDAVFSRLAGLGYEGPFILQAARNGEEKQALKGYASFTRQLLLKHYGSRTAR